jgi:hypothetical protein
VLCGLYFFCWPLVPVEMLFLPLYVWHRCQVFIFDGRRSSASRRVVLFRFFKGPPKNFPTGNRAGPVVPCDVGSAPVPQGLWSGPRRLLPCRGRCASRLLLSTGPPCWVNAALQMSMLGRWPIVDLRGCVPSELAYFNLFFALRRTQTWLIKPQTWVIKPLLFATNNKNKCTKNTCTNYN